MVIYFWTQQIGANMGEKRRRKKEMKQLLKFKEMYMGRSLEPSDVRGDTSEHKFEKMVCDLKRDGVIPWLSGIAKASAMDDWHHKMDFRLRVVTHGEFTHEFNILVNVKSSLEGLKDFKRVHPNSSIKVIAMNHQMNHRWLKKLLEKWYNEEVRKLQSLAPA